MELHWVTKQDMGEGEEVIIPKVSLSLSLSLTLTLSLSLSPPSPRSLSLSLSLNNTEAVLINKGFSTNTAECTYQIKAHPISITS